MMMTFPWVRACPFDWPSCSPVMRFGDSSSVLSWRPAENTLGRALHWARDHGKRFFMWVHLFEPHAPYETHGADAPDVDHSRSSRMRRM